MNLLSDRLKLCNLKLEAADIRCMFPCKLAVQKLMISISNIKSCY